MRLSPAILIVLACLATPAIAADGAPNRLPCRPPLARAADSHGGTTASEPRAMLLLAVDRRMNGCRVLSPASARNDFLPEPSVDGRARKRPARGG